MKDILERVVFPHSGKIHGWQTEISPRGELRQIAILGGLRNRVTNDPDYRNLHKEGSEYFRKSDRRKKVKKHGLNDRYHKPWWRLLRDRFSR